MDYRPFRFALMCFPMLLGVGTIGYVLIEGWSPADSLYMTIITVSTVGYGEVRPLSPGGKVMTSFLIIFGVGLLGYTAAKTFEVIIESGLLRRRRMHRDIERLHDHVVVCGYGRMGSKVAEQLKREGVPFVIIEREPDRVRELCDAGQLALQGDATDDELLIAAGVGRARSLAAVLKTDADNLFVTVSARQLNPDLPIVARSSETKSDEKLRSAGATRVVNLYGQSARIMGRQLTQPLASEFFDAIEPDDDADIHLEELPLPQASALIGQTVRDAPIRETTDVMIVGIRRCNGSMDFNPAPDCLFEAEDTLIVLGRKAEIEALRKLATVTQ